MGLAAVFDKLGQTVIPKIGAKVFPDTMTIVARTPGQDGNGDQTITESNAYTNVPCVYEPKTSQSRRDTGGKLVAEKEYTMTFPVYQNGSRINIDPKIHYFRVNARGLEPVKTFINILPGDESGVVYEVSCEKENA